MSNDGGLNWNILALAQGTHTFSLTVSGDGSRILLVSHFPTRLSTDSGSHWTEIADSGAWAGAAISRDGRLLIGAESGLAGHLHLSRDDGATWAEAGPSQNYVRVASSADGKRLLAAASDGFLYHSNDGGKTWTQRASARTWNALVSSDDGTKLVAVASNGYIYTSSGPLP